MIKIDIISGFLGAGKTSLIKKLFESEIKNEQVVIIENEFGQINIDGTFLKDAGVKIREINSGCICCSLVGDFEKSLKEIIHNYSPDRIIIEPSGVGKLSDIIEAVKKIKDENLSINILCTVVDGKKAKLQLNNFGEFFLNQVQCASSIIVSKTDLIDENKLQETVEIIRNSNESASIITTPINELNGDALLRFLEERTTLLDLLYEINDDDDDLECCCGHHHHHEHDEHCCCNGEHHHKHNHEHHDDCCCGHHDHHHHDHDEHCCCNGEHHHHKHNHEHHDDCCCGHHDHHDHHADEIFTSWGIETVKSVSKESLTNFLETLSKSKDLGLILRSKGILKGNDTDKWYYFDYVSGDYTIRLGEPDYTGRIVVIGSSINEEKIEKLFYKEA